MIDMKLKEIKKRCVLPRCSQRAFFEKLFPQAGLDNLLEDASRLSRIYNGNLRPNCHRGEITVIESIMEWLSEQNNLDHVIMRCRELVQLNSIDKADPIFCSINKYAKDIPTKVYDTLKNCLRKDDCGEALFWLIMLSICGEDISELESLCTSSPIKQITEQDLKGGPPNVYLETRSAMNNSVRFFDRLQGITELTLVNYASTAFITGPLVDTQYHEGETNLWLKYHLSGPNAIRIKIVLTNPDSNADVDASQYKMYPHSIPPEIREYFTLSNETYDEAKRELHQFIIRKNFNTINDIMLRNKLDNIEIYYTDIALPVGIMKSKYRDSALNNILVNIYLPCIGIDDKRPTFVLMEKSDETKHLYNIFDDMILNLEKRRFRGHPNISFLFEKPIIHRAMLSRNFIEMSRESVFRCASMGYPIEVDLLTVADEIIVWRDGDVNLDNQRIPLSQLNRNQLSKLRKQLTNPGDENSQMMTLAELLTLVKEVAKSQGNNPIPLLLEIKDKAESNHRAARDNVIRICRIMKKYEIETEWKGKYAFHTADPVIVRYVKDYDIRIPCGWITLDFEAHKDKYPNISQHFKKLHTNAACFGSVAYQEQRGRETVDIHYAIPDFVSCRIGDYVSEETILRQKCKEYGIKRLGWVAFDQEQYREAIQKEHYDNVLIENFEP